MLGRYYRKYKWFISHYRRGYAIGIIALLLSYALYLLPPWVVGNIADGIVESTITGRELILWLIGLVAVVAANYIVAGTWEYYIFNAGDEVAKLARNRIFKKILGQSPPFFACNTTGSLMGKATNDVDGLAEFAGFGVMALFDATIWPAALIVIMLTISWQLTLLTCLTLPVLIIISKRIATVLYRKYDSAQEAFDKMNQSVLEGVAGIRVVRAYHTEEHEKAKFAVSADHLYKENMELDRYRLLYGVISSLVPGIAFVLSLGMGVYLISTGALTTGALLSFVFYIGMLTWPMMSIGEFANSSQAAEASMDRINELLNYPEDVVDCADPQPAPSEGSIRFVDFSFDYPSVTSSNASDSGAPANAAEDDGAEDNGRRVAGLFDISFALKAGQTLGVVGPVGAGKSTLLKQILHLYPLPENSVFYGGLPLERIRIADLRQQIAFVPQISFLFSRTVRENIMLGATDAMLADGNAAERLEQVLDIADFRKDLPQLPEGIESLAGEKGIALSGGQKQRICIARALMKKDASLLILDDCLSAVDALTEEHILRELRRERAGKTTIIATHRLSSIYHADLILVLDKGRIVARGTHESLLAEGGWYAEQYKLQQMEMRRRKGGGDGDNV
ncbi:MAG: ABC transporter ATP-binding protein [Clostridiaceae bacterium]|nr:ABC transporter ATP-binding protein [Clostridiaceae bacterium]